MSDTMRAKEWALKFKEAEKALSQVEEIEAGDEGVKEAAQLMCSKISKAASDKIFAPVFKIAVVGAEAEVNNILNDPVSKISKQMRQRLERSQVFRAAVARKMVIEIIESEWNKNPVSDEVVNYILARVGNQIIGEVLSAGPLAQVNSKRDDGVNSVEAITIAATSKKDKKEDVQAADTKYVNDITESSSAPVSTFESPAETLENIPPEITLEKVVEAPIEAPKDTLPEITLENVTKEEDIDNLQLKDAEEMQSITPVETSIETPVEAPVPEKAKRVRKSSPKKVDAQENPSTDTPPVETAPVDLSPAVSNEEIRDKVSKAMGSSATEIVNVIGSEWSDAEIFIRDCIEAAYEDHTKAAVIKYDLDKQFFDSATFEMALASNTPVILHNFPYNKRHDFEKLYGKKLKIFVVTGSVMPENYSPTRRAEVQQILIGKDPIEPGTITTVKTQGTGSEQSATFVKNVATILTTNFGG